MESFELQPPFAISQIVSYLQLEDLCRSLLPASKGMLALVAAVVEEARIDCAGKTRLLHGTGGASILKMLKRYVRFLFLESVTPTSSFAASGWSR